MSRATSPIERLQALLVEQIEPCRRLQVADQIRAAVRVELMAGLDADDDEDVAAWLAATLRELVRT